MTERRASRRSSTSLRRLGADASRFITMEPRRRRLLVVAAGLLLIARGALSLSGRHFASHDRDFAVLSARLPLASCTPEEAAWALSAAAHRLPGTLCLAWALALRAWLSSMGIPNVLRFGVARVAAGGIAAHAWIEAAGRSWTFGDAVENYVEMRADAARGTEAR